MDEERRRTPRWQIKAYAKVRTSEDDHLVNCIVVDLNLKGLRLFVDEPLSDSKQFKMVLALTEDFHLNVGVETAWVKAQDEQFMYGMSFSTIMDKDRERISEYLTQRYPEEAQKKWWSQDGQLGA